MATRVAKAKKLDVAVPAKGKQSVTITWEDDKIGYYTYPEGPCPLAVFALYSYEYEDKKSGKTGKPYQKVSKIEEWKPPTLTKEELAEKVRRETIEKQRTVVNQIISPELRAELKIRVLTCIIHEVFNAFINNKITEATIKEWIFDLAYSMFTEVDEFKG